MFQATSTFHGAKGAILLGANLLATLRDDVPGITFPGFWDLPGGGREGAEGPRQTLAREAMEEVGLDLSAAAWLWARAFPSGTHPGETSWFFVLRLPPEAARGIVLGDEGQGWALMPPRRFEALPRGVPFLQRRLALARTALGL